MIIYSIYKIVNNVNGKVYIGFDSNWPNRKLRHYYQSRSKGKNFALYFAIKKYGWDNFDFELLYQSKDREHTLKEMEPFFIEQYNSYYEGYNMTKGGQGTFGKKQSVKNKQTQSKIMTERNKKSRWYNNGVINTFTTENPGCGWNLGRLNQKPTTKNYKWYNNGKEQKLSKRSPKGWKLGMLNRNNFL